MKNVCHINFSANYVELYRNVSLARCKMICNQVISESCSGIFWNRLEGSCWLTSHTGDNQSDTDCDSRRKDIVFFRRRRTPCKLRKELQYIINYIPSKKNSDRQHQLRNLLKLDNKSNNYLIS